ncbi:tRNA 2-thiouridine(34) synthase MnmA [Pseudodesulfovibrio senegalensis]|uniref:tRNA-specific 2-thiouridylase MnmA n=1 Tax=Pseudodesulfovibrio senegalensis TaxID=1721087 RepID=A0A6N6N8D6_9BACT|nr:tRNA 2-thiouridine(34) synthase MnmA [Pseudodesulfovibrio senegalensis]KAB1443871.1 tRNA 2-thiouridine(34) synthase MnmA [Pseudodesulfovibrio senegalensis]
MVRLVNDSGKNSVAVGVSGGMDSLLALCLLKEQGRSVLAVHAYFLRPGPQWEAVGDGLQQACDTLGVALHVVDLHREFEQSVVDRFVADYRAGLTPNPCAACNPLMKFGSLFDHVRTLGAQRLATGHYARMQDVAPWGSMLVRGADRSKDQSYFLSLVPIERLRCAEFPLADVHKKDVPEILSRHGLEPPLPSESQEICFVPDDDYQAFLVARGSMPGHGAMVLPDGTRVGTHKGLWRYTQGQRRGLGVAWQHPLYVLDKDVVSNTLIVGPKELLESPGCVVESLNLMTGPETWPQQVWVQTRYRQQAKPSRFAMRDGKVLLHFVEPHSRPTPGQVAAVYTEDGVVLGGGIITAAL